MTPFLLLVALAYVLQVLFLLIGLERANRVSTKSLTAARVSVIVAARNEEQHIERCLKSLLAIDYPSELLEIILVNDGSTDRTLEIIHQSISPHRPIKVVTTSPGQGNLRGKANAVSQGIDASSGDILMFTDADCTVPAEWITETLKFFDAQTGVVGGFTVLEAEQSFEGVQALDWLFLFGLSSAAAGWNRPLTAIGNNLAVRRSAYEQTGGYVEIPFSVTEDYALVRSILRKTKYIVRFPCSARSAVRSQACHTASQLYHQKQRWGVGGLDMVFHGKVIMTIGWLAKLAIVISFLSGNLTALLFTASSIFLMELRFLWKPMKCLGVLRYVKYFLAFELYFTLYVLVIPFVAFFSRKVVWKERSLGSTS